MMGTKVTFASLVQHRRTKVSKAICSTFTYVFHYAFYFYLNVFRVCAADWAYDWTRVYWAGLVSNQPLVK